MPRYAITEKAGPFVAAHRNTGVGTILDLTEQQAEHELRLGSLVELPIVTSAEFTIPEETPAETATQNTEVSNTAGTVRKQKRLAT